MSEGEDHTPTKLGYISGDSGLQMFIIIFDFFLTCWESKFSFHRINYQNHTIIS